MRELRLGRPPAKGSKARHLLLLAMRPEGVTVHEVVSICGIRSSAQVAACITMMRDQKGYDLRMFPLAPDQFTPDRVGPKHLAHPRRRPSVYRLVGKMRWDGSYRSFIHKETKS